MDSASGILEGSHDDVWDDSELIKAYDKAVKSWRKQKKRLPDNNCNEDSLSVGPGPWVSVEKTDEDNVIQSLPAAQSTLDPSCEVIWKIGCPCRAKYSEDDMFYEARIVDIAGDTCTVRYYGYGNQETVHVSDLLKSEGKLARDRQKEEAKAAQQYDDEDLDDIEDKLSQATISTSLVNNISSDRESETQTNCSSVKGIPMESASTSTGHCDWGSMTANFFPNFPIPPLPASLAGPDGTFEFGRGELPSLLLSWYMSGYHAGYFDAKKDLSKTRQTN